MHNIIFTVAHNTPSTNIGETSPVSQVSELPVSADFRHKAMEFLVRRCALIVLASFAVAGVWILDDYGVGLDAGFQRGVATWHLDYVLGKRDFIYPYHNHNRFYGVSFELPLLLLERALGLEDTRDIHLMRHMVTHLFFLVGGFFCYLLAYRLFGSRLLALLAMLLFLLHPRIYAHSFFNSKDVPFLSMSMICLYLMHRAFDRANIWWIVILGIAVGVLINIRIMGMAFFAVVLGMCLLDLFQASDRKEWRHVLGNAGMFVLSCMATLYAVSPYLWPDPVGRLAEWLETAADHPNIVLQRFTGELTLSTDINPLEYVPVWMSITTQPVAVALGVIGASIVLLRGLFRPRDVFRSTRLRFGFLLIACLMLPIVSATLLGSNLWDGWRQVYFLYAPFCMMAVFGVYWMTSVIRVTHLRAGLYGAFGIGVAVAATSMFSIHPYQHLYFNFLVDRTTPEHLRSRYDMDYWYITFREALEHILDVHSYPSVYVQTSNTLAANSNWDILEEADRRRMVLGEGDSDFYITNYYSWRLYEGERQDPTTPLIYNRVIYGSKVLSVAAVDLSLAEDTVAASYRDVYNATIHEHPSARSNWDLYVDGAVLVYIKETCMANDFDAPFFLHVSMDDIDDLPEHRRRNGHSTRNFDFDFGMYGVRFDGKCMAVVPLPDDGVSGVRTGQWTSDGELWDVAINIRTGGKSAYRKESASVIGDVPLISSEFDVYIDDGRLIYVRESCVNSDVGAKFFLHVVPSDVDDLPLNRRESGFENLDFVFDLHGVMLDRVCVASVGLPDYKIERIRTGQWDSELQRDLWKEEFEVD